MEKAGVGGGAPEPVLPPPPPLPPPPQPVRTTRRTPRVLMRNGAKGRPVPVANIRLVNLLNRTYSITFDPLCQLDAEAVGRRGRLASVQSRVGHQPELPSRPNFQRGRVHFAVRISHAIRGVTRSFQFFRSVVQIAASVLIPLIPFSAELQRIGETIETVAEDRNRL
jgi:hypothetical protein